MLPMKLQNKILGKIVIVPHYKGKTFQFRLYRYTKWALLSCTLILLLVFGWAYYQYRYYTDKLLSLLNDNTVTNLSMNQISLDGIQIKRELIRLKRESDAMDKFITQAKQFDKDAFAGLSLLYSTKTFPDFFRGHAKAWDASHPASSTDLPVGTKDKATILKESAERQKTYRALMDVTPSGYPLDGKVILKQSLFSLPSVVIKAPVGTPIHATATGTVVSLEQTKDGYAIQIAHHNPNNNKDIRTSYHFCMKPTVTLDQQVKKGQVIAYVGILTGSSQSLMGYQVQIDRIYIQPK